MIKGIKSIINFFSKLFVVLLSSNKVGHLIIEILINKLMNKTIEIEHEGINLRFTVPNTLNKFRVNTFSTKEPETLQWIDDFHNGCTFWDIGANVGLYSIYAAKQKKCQVFSFEPSVFNLELLARNIFLNDLQNKISIIPIALSDKLGPNYLRMTNTEWGGALSSFGKDFGWDGNKIQQEFTYQTMGCTLDQSKDLLHITQPDYIKIDVDGLEHIILQKGINVLHRTKSILVEINDDFEEQQNQSRLTLTKSGFSLLEKKHSTYLDNTSHGFQNTFNQIWYRK